MPSGDGFAFGPFRLDWRTKRLLRDGVTVDLSPRELDVLHLLVERAPDVVTKDDLIKAAWRDVAVGDSSLVKVIKQLRDRLDPDDEERYIKTVVRRGYRCVVDVTDHSRALDDASLEALMEPYRAFTEGRAALLSRARSRLPGALAVFRTLVERDPQRAVFHVGLANAAILLFDSTRAEDAPDTAMVSLAAHHAREGRRLDPMSGEAWITEGVVLERAGDRRGAAAALRRGVELEPLCLRHHIRRAFGSWGEDRIAAATMALRLSPRLPDAHLLMATVFVARDNAAEAERQLDAGLAAMPDPEEPSGLQVGLYWLKGLLRQLRGPTDDAIAWLDRELDLEPHGHVYARECCASALYAKGAMLADRGDTAAAREAYAAALSRAPRHAMARARLVILDGHADRLAAADLPDREARLHIDEAMARAAILVHVGRTDAAVELCHRALAASPPGNAGWLLPIDPLLRVSHDKTPWTRVLDLLRRRAEDGA